MGNDDTNGEVQAASPQDAGDTGVLNKLIEILRPLKPEARHRNVRAAMIFLGETLTPQSIGEQSRLAASVRRDDGNYSQNNERWMRQNNVSPEELEEVFHFNGEEFDIHAAPGTSKKEQTLNTYILTGLGTFLAKGERTFADATARSFCDKLGCSDPTNHAKHLKARGNEFGGDKAKGYTMTNPGLRRGAELVKTVAGSAK
jgi:hypothetical protein